MMVKKIIMVFLVLFAIYGIGNHELVNGQAPEEQPKSDASVGQTPANPDHSKDSKSAKPEVRPGDEVLALKEKILEIQNNSDLGFVKVVACNSAEGYGVYSPLEPNHPGTKVIFYVEPANYGVLRSEGRFIIDCAVDLFILDTSGKLLARNENVRKINKVSRSPVLDLYFTLELNIPKTVKQKSFIVKIVFNDRIKNKSVSTSQRVQLNSISKKGEENI
jgi:hypothetical protein